MVRRLMSLPFMVMAAWTGVLGWLLYNDNYQLLLAPKFGFLVCISMVLSLLYAACLGTAGIQTGNGHRTKGLILALPILFIFFAGENTLGNFALSKRTISPLQTNPLQGTGPETSAPEPLSNAAPADLPLVSISTLVRNWDAYDGKRVRVEGLFSPSVSGHEELSAVFRYFINCCAADAMPVGFVFPSLPDTDTGPKENDWVMTGGKVHMGELDGYALIHMDIEFIEKKEKPSKNAAYMFD